MVRLAQGRPDDPVYCFSYLVPDLYRTLYKKGTRIKKEDCAFYDVVRLATTPTTLLDRHSLYLR